MMFGLGTIINCSAIIIAGIAGMVFGNHLKESMQNTLILSNAEIMPLYAEIICTFPPVLRRDNVI